MALPTVSGQSLMDELTIRLGGYAAAFSVDELLSFVNEAKDAVYGVLRTLDEDYFVIPSQVATSTDDDYFAALTTTAREFDLPNGCREVRAIEVITAGYEDVPFEFRNLSDPDFQAERRSGAIAGAGSGRQLSDVYLFTVLGRRTLQLAAYPESAFTVKLWFVKALDDLTPSDTLTDILHPFTKKISSYATERATLSLQDEQLSNEWLKRWRMDVQELALTAAPRVSTSPEFVSDWDGA
jgi:hypothetical protein